MSCLLVKLHGLINSLKCKNSKDSDSEDGDELLLEDISEYHDLLGDDVGLFFLYEHRTNLNDKSICRYIL